MTRTGAGGGKIALLGRFVFADAGFCRDPATTVKP
jgi:hypothetical protein